MPLERRFSEMVATIIERRCGYTGWGRTGERRRFQGEKSDGVFIGF